LRAAARLNYDDRHVKPISMAAVIFVAVVVSCGYFYTGGGWNQASRFNLVRALVEQHTVRIDAYQSNTGDKAFSGGHYYSDKAPGTSLLATPFVAVAGPIARLFTDSPEAVLFHQARVATMVCATIPTAIAAVVIFLAALALGCSAAAGAVAALTYGIGTPAWAHGTFFWGHALAAGCLSIAFLMVVRLWQASERGHERDARRGLVFGLASGWAAVTEFPAAGAVLILFIGALRVTAANGGGPRAARLAAFIALGGLGPALILGAYNTVAFGSPLHLGYQSVVGYEGMQQGLLGITYPKPKIVLHLLIGTEAGLALLAPVLVLAPLGFWALVRERGRRVPAITALSLFLYYLLLNASYFYWRGGWAYGPRQLSAGLPFLCLGLAPLWDRGPRLRITVGVFAALGVVLTLMAVAVQPMTPQSYRWPHRDLFFDAFLRGALSRHNQAFFSAEPSPSFNLGEWLGLRGLPSLLPLLLAWAALALWWRRARSQGQATQTTLAQ
jgi:hypothetical protein